MTTPEILDLQQKYLMQTYSAELPLLKGQGARVWDADGKEYLDFTSGISVCNLGHCHPVVTEAIQRQAARLVHVSNLFVNEVQPQLAALIAQRSFDARVFFANSGAEANEAMIKFARRWGSPRGRHEIICMEHCFHGRTITTLAATDKPEIRQGFGPLTEGFSFVPFNDLEALDRAITENTAAVMLEAIQGEGGVRPARLDYLAGVRELCHKYEILMLLDEVQTGMGRTGELFGYQHSGVSPDAMSLAKALGNGFPIGALVVSRKWEGVLDKGSHATTFGGTPLACAAARAVFKVIEDEDLLFNVKQMGEHLKGALIQLAGKYPLIKDVRGPGLMLGFELEDGAKELVGKAAAKGLLLLTAAGNVVRVYPPLNVDKTTLDQGVGLLDQALAEL